MISSNLESIINQYFYTFSSIYGYLFSLKLGDVNIEFKQLKDTKIDFNNNLKKIDQKYYKVDYVASIEIDCKCHWSLFYNNSEIANSDLYDHEESEKIINTYLTGFFVESIIEEDENIGLKFSNDILLKMHKINSDDYIFINDNLKKT